MSGQEVSLGRVATVRDRVGAVVLTERRVMPFDRDHLVAVGVDLAAVRHPRGQGRDRVAGAVRGLARQVAFVDCPGSARAI